MTPVPSNQDFDIGVVDASIATRGLSRWHNYYVEGLRWITFPGAACICAGSPNCPEGESGLRERVVPPFFSEGEFSGERDSREAGF